jgi:hypothetical protein
MVLKGNFSLGNKLHTWDKDTNYKLMMIEKLPLKWKLY